MKGSAMPEFVTDEEFVPNERAYANGPRGPRKRTEDQEPWDEAFGHAQDSTGYLHAQVGPDEVDDARKRVAAAARYHGKGITEGQAKPGKVKGKVILSWKIRDVVKRKAKSENETSE